MANLLPFLANGTVEQVLFVQPADYQLALAALDEYGLDSFSISIWARLSNPNHGLDEHLRQFRGELRSGLPREYGAEVRSELDRAFDTGARLGYVALGCNSRYISPDKQDIDQALAGLTQFGRFDLYVDFARNDRLGGRLLEEVKASNFTDPKVIDSGYFEVGFGAVSHAANLEWAKMVQQN